MPIEERYITFNLNEIYTAVQILSKQQEGTEQPPAGTLELIEIEGENESVDDVIYLTVANENGDKDKLRFDRAFFAMALVLLCQANAIPLPKQGTKVLKILEDKIIMKISLES